MKYTADLLASVLQEQYKVGVSLNQKWLPLLYIIPHFDAWFKMHTFILFKKLNHRNIFEFKEI